MEVPASLNLPPGTIEKAASQLGLEIALPKKSLPKK